VYLAAAFDVNREKVSWIHADFHGHAADPQVQV